VQARDGGWAFPGFRNREADGVFSFELLDPIRVRLDDAGDGLTVR
jgi:hypothetical protein